MVASRHSPRVDATQHEIVVALRGVGCTVVSLAAVGAGVPDLLVGWMSPRGKRMLLMEVKAARGPRGGGGGYLTPAQMKFWGEWRGTPIVTVRSVDEALAALGAGGSRD